MLPFSRARSLLVEAEHSAAERRVVVFLRPSFPIRLDSEPTACGLKLVEVDPAAMVAADKFEPIVAKLSHLVTPAVRHRFSGSSNAGSLSGGTCSGSSTGRIGGLKTGTTKPPIPARAANV